MVVVRPEVVVRRYRRGWSQTRIADAAGVTRATVRTILLDQGVTIRAVPGPVTAYPTDRDWWVARFAAVREAGVWRRVAVSEVSAEFGVSRTVILRRLSRLQIPPHVVKPVPAPGAIATPDQAELWLSGATRWEGTCRRWVFTRVLTGTRPYPVAMCGGKRVGVIRLVWSWQHGPVPAGHDIIHLDGCGFADCVRLEHLRCTAVPDRIADQVGQGAFPRGGQHWAAKLTEDQARHILTSSLTDQELATRYGVARSTIHAIRSRRRWKHL